MWLLNTARPELKQFNRDIPPYAILSHVWSSEEVSFTDMKKAKNWAETQGKIGYTKILGCCRQAAKDGYEWAWIDSCCIDKRSSAELSEAINSMFEWYRRSKRCYVYLADVNGGKDAVQELKSSQWFTRGWTLQELLAPSDIVFYDRNWVAIGQTQRHRAVDAYEGVWLYSPFGIADGEFSYANLTSQLSEITGVPRQILAGTESIFGTCVAQRMYWASRRQTTRPEDRAYSLMGLFDISMSVLYGEGLEKAFDRLQREIMSKNPDQSIFAWYRPNAFSSRLLAESPDHFRDSGHVITLSNSRHSPFHMTNIGMRITLPVTTISNPRLYEGESAHAVLDCAVKENGELRRLTLSLDFLSRDPEGINIFVCNRPYSWTFCDTKAAKKLQSMYIVPRFTPDLS